MQTQLSLQLSFHSKKESGRYKIHMSHGHKLDYCIYYILYTIYSVCTMYHVPCTMYHVLYYRLFMYYVLGTIYYIPILENGCQSIGIYIPIMLGFDDCVPIQPIWTWHTLAQRCLSWHPWTSFGKEPWRESISADIMSGWFQTAQSNTYI